jgi:hypothetical protein
MAMDRFWQQTAITLGHWKNIRKMFLEPLAEAKRLLTPMQLANRELYRMTAAWEQIFSVVYCKAFMQLQNSGAQWGHADEPSKLACFVTRIPPFDRKSAAVQDARRHDDDRLAMKQSRRRKPSSAPFAWQ